MDARITDSDVVIFAIAAGCMVAVVIVELLRFAITDIYEWIADYRSVLRETKEARSSIERFSATSRDLIVIRDRKNAERFRLKSSLSRWEMERAGLERARIEFWHELGQRTIGDQPFVARVQNRPMADQSLRAYDSAPVIWRYGNQVRIWAQSERMAQHMLTTAFPPMDGYAHGDIVLEQAPGATP